jgi:hypothetical protein
MIERHGPDFWTTGEGAEFDGEWKYETDRDASLHVSPRRVLAECAAKRAIVDLAYQAEALDDQVWSEFGLSTDRGYNDPRCGERILRALALPYADHDGYDPSWGVQ